MIGKLPMIVITKSKLHVDKYVYNVARYKININIKTAFFENKLTESIGTPKEVWKALKSLRLPNKISSCEVKALKINNWVEHDVHSVLEGFKCYYSILAENLAKPLPKPAHK